MDHHDIFRNARVYLLVCTVFLVPALLFPQTQNDSSRVSLSVEEDDRAEIVLEPNESESDDSGLLDRLNWIEEHPFDLNTVTQAELESLPLVSGAEAQSVLDLRARNGTLRSVEEVRSIPENGTVIYAKLRGYVTVDLPGVAPRGTSTVEIRSRVYQNLQESKGFRDGTYLGSPIKGYSRITLRESEGLQGGLLFEKDSGERIGDGFTSGYLSLNDLAFFPRVVIGDYVVESGQGLVFWRAAALGKGGAAVSVVTRKGIGVQPYRSTDETNFMRGVAATTVVHLGGSDLELTGIYSRKARSATIEAGNALSLYDAGLFQTESDLARKGTLGEKIVGARIQLTGAWTLGMTAYRSTFDKPMVADRTFEFAGSSASVAGVDAEVNLGSLLRDLSLITISGEVARSHTGAGAGIASALFSFSPRAQVAIAYRDYSPRFISLHGNAFGERSSPANERGFYVGCTVRVSRSVRFTAFMDHFTFPWRTFDNPLPGGGREVFLQTDASILRGLKITARYSNKLNERLEPSTDALARDIRITSGRVQEKVRVTASYNASKTVRLRGRIETTDVRYRLTGHHERGWLFYQDLRYAPTSGLTVELRLIFFDSPSYDSRMYEYENDLRGVFSNPALFGKGRRWYMLLQWNIRDALRLSAKYAVTQKDGVASLGSGQNEIEGDTDSRIAVQLDFGL